MTTLMRKPAAGDTGRDFPLSDLEQRLLGEALRMLAETRARALELCAEVNRRQGGAVPDVHDFNLPAIIDLQRRFGTRPRPSGEAGTPGDGPVPGRFA
ncbi:MULTISPECIES: hypothetical protein [Burkholderia]|uniref:Uncharacterized protein n=1 Tax=Burkholderia cenocepacia TaxID=95486 RepID=A0A071M1R4_9BURK|nr:hypothetical protein [Burkholderia seminalis]AOJ27188.1 hypothetical protein WJ12_20155 [Burkholderia seminalis]KVF42258.1 hypothetical protein WJ13_03510 [Burkholderia seminalis]MCA8038348.1 hypothetical protein [Burkholderia seminalis]MCA8430368.1 hypothetical protein [Burkholderia seminalis]MDN7850513.1 hypothetical protein [Burkholderia seminalis]